jgi:hypothetical protein
MPPKKNSKNPHNLKYSEYPTTKRAISHIYASFDKIFYTDAAIKRFKSLVKIFLQIMDKLYQKNHKYQKTIQYLSDDALALIKYYGPLINIARVRYFRLSPSEMRKDVMPLLNNFDRIRRKINKFILDNNVSVNVSELAQDSTKIIDDEKEDENEDENEDEANYQEQNDENNSEQDETLDTPEISDIVEPLPPQRKLNVNATPFIPMSRQRKLNVNATPFIPMSRR